MQRGTVKFFSEAKGFGFIERDDGEEDAFVHLNQIGDGQLLEEGQRVEFTMGENPRNGRTRAENVKVVG